MKAKLINGDYSLDESNKIITVELAEELLQNAFVALNTKRGNFYPDKNFGSYIKNQNENASSELLLAFARQALSEIDGVWALDAKTENNNFIIKLLINDEESEVSINLENDI